MSVRSIIRSHIVADSEVTDLVPADHWFAASSITDDNRPANPPFAVMRYGVRSIGMGQAKRSVLEVFVHDEPGTYETVDKILDRLHSRLDGAEHLSDEDSEVVSVKWFSTGGDLFDAGFRTIVKTATFDLVTIGE